MAFCYYRQIYAGLMSPHAGMLTAAVVARGAGGGGGSSSSSRGALSNTPSKYGSGGNSGGEADDTPLPLPLYADDRV